MQDYSEFEGSEIGNSGKEGFPNRPSPANTNAEIRRLLHELHQPLTVVIAICELANYKQMDEEVRQDFETILQEAEKLKKISLAIKSNALKLPGYYE